MSASAQLQSLCKRHPCSSEAARHAYPDAIELMPLTCRLWHLPGHNLYPDGDPRATLMLSGIQPTEEMQVLADDVLTLTGLHPNCDFALAVMTEALDLPDGAPFTVFLLGRAVGWCAHVIEQNRDGTLIRPRGRYEGEPPW
jgi:citrate synthase